MSGEDEQSAATLASAPERIRELERFALERLPAMQLSDGVFCEEVVAGDPKPRGRSLRYTLIVLIGLLRASEADIDHPFHVGAMRTRVLGALGGPELGAGELGLALWAEARLDGSANEELLENLKSALGDEGIETIDGRALAWVMLGLIEVVSRDESEVAEQLLAMTRAQMLAARRMPSGLLIHAVKGPRKRFPTFATQAFSALALSKLARNRADADALEAARAIAEKLCELQLPDGAWPWHLDARRGTIVESYELYSVNQDALAPMAMNSVSEATGDGRYAAAALRGLDWIWGENELGTSMYDPDARMVYRSIRRRERLDRAYLYGRTAASYVRPPKIRDARKSLEVDRTDRPSHPGWLLEAWAGREDLAQPGRYDQVQPPAKPEPADDAE